MARSRPVCRPDLKYINAYSSVSHCGMVLFALLMCTQTAITGAILQMLSHGLMTALFFAVIGMTYHRAGTRDVRYLGGLMKVIPFLAVSMSWRVSPTSVSRASRASWPR